METAKKTTKRPTRRVSASKPEPVIVEAAPEKPTVEVFENDPTAFPQYRVMESASGSKSVVRRAAATAMKLPTGITQPVDDEGNVTRTTVIVTRDAEKIVESTVELLTKFSEARESWVVALRTARWTRKHNIRRDNGEFYLSCTTKSASGTGNTWGTNSTPGIYHEALARFNAAQKPAAKKAPAKRTSAPKPTTAKRASAKPA